MALTSNLITPQGGKSLRATMTRGTNVYGKNGITSGAIGRGKNNLNSLRRRLQLGHSDRQLADRSTGLSTGIGQSRVMGLNQAAGRRLNNRIKTRER